MPSRVPRLLAALLGLTAACYAATLAFRFVYDDHEQIVTNPYVQSWRYLPFYFHSNVWAQKMALGNYYRPVFMTWLLAARSAFGLHPILWHAASVVLHVVVTWLVYRLALRLTQHAPTSLVAAALFGVHPVHAESVAWISGITEPLLALFFLLSFLAWLRYRESREPRWIALSVVCFALALFAKETAVVLPAVILLHEWLYSAPASHGQRLREGARAMATFGAAIVLYFVARDFALRGLVHTLVLPWHYSLLAIPMILWRYLRLLVAPVGLSPFYYTPYVTSVTEFRFWFPLLMLVCGFLAVAVAWRIRRSPAVLFAAGWMALTIAPPLAILVMAQEDIVHDRYLYLPSVGFCLLVAIGLRRLARGDQRRLGAAAGVLIALYGGLTVYQSLFWRTDETLFRRAFEVAPEHPFSAIKYAKELERQERYERAEEVYRVALQRDPDSWPANLGVAMAAFHSGRYADAETYMDRALELVRTSDEFYVLALAQEKQGKLAEAEANLQRAIHRDPRVPEYRDELGELDKRQDKQAEAREAFRTALQLNPGDTRARRELAEMP